MKPKTKKEMTDVEAKGLLIKHFLKLEPKVCPCGGLMHPRALDLGDIPVVDKDGKVTRIKKCVGTRGFFCDTCTNCTTI